MRVIGVDQAAERLGVSARRVRQLLARGQLPGQQVGRDWVIDASSLAEYVMRRKLVGRPWQPSAAWAVLQLANGEAPALSPVEKLRARRRLDDFGLAGLVGRLRSRAGEYRCYAHSSAIERLSNDGSVVRSGVSAVRDHDVDLVADGAAELYVQRRHLADLVDRYALDMDAERPNVVLHVVDDDVWPFEKGADVAPWPVVAVDLMDADDERSRRAGHKLAEQRS